MKRTLACVLLFTGCAAPPLPAVTTPDTPKSLGRVLFTADVGDHVLVCVEPTAAMRMLRPTADTMICGETVGDLRAQFIRQWSAN